MGSSALAETASHYMATDCEFWRVAQTPIFVLKNRVARHSTVFASASLARRDRRLRNRLQLRLPRREYARISNAVVVPIADHRLIARSAELEHAVLRVDPMVVVRIEDPLPTAEHADLVDTFAREIAHDRNVAR